MRDVQSSMMQQQVGNQPKPAPHEYDARGECLSA